MFLVCLFSLMENWGIEDPSSQLENSNNFFFEPVPKHLIYALLEDLHIRSSGPSQPSVFFTPSLDFDQLLPHQN